MSSSIPPVVPNRTTNTNGTTTTKNQTTSTTPTAVGGSGNSNSGGRGSGSGQRRGGGGGRGGTTSSSSGPSPTPSSTTTHPTSTTTTTTTSTNTTGRNSSRHHGGGRSSSSGRSSSGRGGGSRNNNNNRSDHLPPLVTPPPTNTFMTSNSTTTTTINSSNNSSSSNNHHPKPKVSSSSNRNRSRGGKPSTSQRKEDEEKEEEQQQKRLEDIRVSKEKEEQQQQILLHQEQTRLETIQLLLQQQQQQQQQRAREMERQQRTTAVQDAILLLQYTYDTSQYHIHARQIYQNHPDTLQQLRMEFERTKKTIKVDLKKCTTFIKKIKMGTYWNPIGATSSISSTIITSSSSTTTTTSTSLQPYQMTQQMIETITHDVASLNLSRYVEEVVAAILECCSIPSSHSHTTTCTSGMSSSSSSNSNTTTAMSTTTTGGSTTSASSNNNKMSALELSVIMALIQAMHTRYADFLSNLLPPLWNALLLLNDTTNHHNKNHRRLYVRFMTELVLHGLLSQSDTQKFLKYIMEWSGGNKENSTTSSSHVVPDAVAVVAFIRTAGFEILGTVPTTIRNAIQLLQNEYELYQQQRALSHNIEDDTLMEHEGSNVPFTTDSLPSDTDPIVVVDANLLDKAMKLVQQLQPVLKEQRAIPESTSESLIKHCVGAYRAMSTSYVQTHQKMKKLEKRCAEDRLIAGQLTAQREKGFTDAQKLCDTLQKSVEVLADCLNEPMPIIVNDDENDGDRALNTGGGIEVWTKDSNDANKENYGPFDDEETRSFYCDIPDLLATIPPALLGLSDEQVEKQQSWNAHKYAVGSSTHASSSSMVDNVVPTMSDTMITPTSAEQLDAAEQGVTLDDDDVEGNKAEGDNKDTPHYRLMLLLEQELPECNRREQLDEIAEKFATNHGSSKNSRKRLLKALFLVPRSRLDLLPFYCRLVATLDHVYADVATSLVTNLAQQFHGQAKFKKNQNIESRMRTARYLSELTKFRCAAPIVILNCLALCNEDFTGYNVEVACCILESCGRFLYRTKHTNPRIVAMMETMNRLSKAKNLDERLQSLLKAAFYNVKPPLTASRKKVKEYPPLEAYLRHLLLVRLDASESVISMVTKQLVRMPWFDPSYQCAALICKLMLKACRKGRYKTIEAVAGVAAKLRTQRAAGEVPIRLTDAVLEELRWALEQPNFRDQQRIITYTRLLGELHVVGQVSASLIIDQLYEFMNYGHEIPESLRQASKEFTTKAAMVETEESSTAKLPVYNSSSGVTQVIQEDEEMEDAELIPNVVEVKEAPKPVAVAPYSIFDPRVPSAKDSATSTYRITLICTLLETSARALVTRSNIPRLKGFFAAFQRYLFTKTVLPTDVEFALLDTFDVVDSHWKRVSTGRGGNSSASDSGFPRYSSWLDAHMATLAMEESEAAFQAQKRARLETLADESKSLPEISSTDGDHDERSLFHDDDESESSGEDDEDESVSVKSKDSAGIDVALDDDGNEMDVAPDEDIAQSVDSEDGDNVDEDDAESEASCDDDEEDEDDDYEDDEEEFDEEAYMLQLEEEAFERELRILTMEAIEKGKVTSRKQVDDSMISGSQIMKRKPSDSSKFASSSYNTEPHPSTSVALSGGTGISFQVIKKGNKGKIELKELVVPVDTNLAVAATRHDDAAAKERDEIKQRVLRYEAQSESSTGGNVYLEQGRLERNRNRPLSMEDIDKNFGTSGGNLHPSQVDKKPTSTNTASSTGGQRGNATNSGRGAFNSYPGGRGLGRGGGRTNIGGRHLF